MGKKVKCCVCMYAFCIDLAMYANNTRSGKLYVAEIEFIPVTFTSLLLFYRLKESDLQLRFCTNETQATREKFVAKLQRLGFDISVSEVFPPAPAAIAVLKERGLRPHLLVHDGNAPKYPKIQCKKTQNK